MNFTIGSSLSNKNFFAEVVFLLIPFQLYGLWVDQGKVRLLFLIGIILSFVWLFLLLTLSTWLAVIISGLVVVILCVFYRPAKGLINISFFSSRKKWIYLTPFIFLIILSIYFSTSTGYIRTVEAKAKIAWRYWNDRSLLDSTSLVNENSVYERIMIWRNSVSLIRDNPAFGCGLNNWKILQPRYGIGGTQFLNTGTVHFEHPHNDYLLVWSEQGTIGLVLYLLFFFLVFRFAARSLRNSTDPSEKILLLLMIAAVCGFMLMSFFGYPRSRFYSMLLLMLQCSFIFKSGLQSSSARGNTKPSSLNLPLYLGFVIISCLACIAAWYRVSGEVHIKQAQVAQLSKNYARMVREADKAESFWFPLDLTNTPVRWYCGMAQFYSNNIDDARIEFERAVTVNPYHLSLLNDLGTCYEHKGDYGQAISYYKRALVITPGFIEALLNLSAAYFNQHEIDSAYKVLSFVTEKRMNEREHQNLNLFRSSILYALAARDSLNYQDSLQRKSFLDFIDNDTVLTSVFDESKQKNQTFAKILEIRFRTGRKQVFLDR